MPTLTLVFSNESLLCIYIYPDVPRREYILNVASSCKDVIGYAHYSGRKWGEGGEPANFQLKIGHIKKCFNQKYNRNVLRSCWPILDNLESNP